MIEYAPYVITATVAGCAGVIAGAIITFSAAKARIVKAEDEGWHERFELKEAHKAAKKRYRKDFGKMLSELCQKMDVPLKTDEMLREERVERNKRRFETLKEKAAANAEDQPSEQAAN